MINQNRSIQIMYYIEWYNDFINADEKKTLEVVIAFK